MMMPPADKGNGHQPLEPEHFTDLGNARRLVAAHGAQLRYVHAWETYLVWDGARWARDETGEVDRRAKATVASMYVEAGYSDDEAFRKKLGNHAIKSESERALRAMVAVARSEPGMPVTPDSLDADPWLLNCANGTLDLQTGQLGQHNPDDLITKVAPVDYRADAECPLWRATLLRVFAGDESLIAFFQRCIGYALTGDTSEQVFFVLFGGGSNGKSTVVDAITAMLGLGHYADQAPASMLMIKSIDAIPNDVAKLRGMRFVFACETANGRRLDEAGMKQLTGGDPVTARFMRAEFFTFRPTFKLFLATNHRPTIRGTDHAIWRRIRLIPFAVTIPDEEQDKKLGEKLRAGELSGILRWAVEGCLAWQRDGLGAAEEVRVATAEYRRDMDVLGDFLRERCVLDEPDAEMTVAELYDAYKSWCQEANEREVTKKALGLELSERGLRKARTNKTRVWAGIRLRLLTDGDAVTDGDAYPDSSRVNGFVCGEGETASRHVTRHEEEGELPGWVRE